MSSTGMIPTATRGSRCHGTTTVATVSATVSRKPTPGQERERDRGAVDAAQQEIEAEQGDEDALEDARIRVVGEQAADDRPRMRACARGQPA